MTVTARFDDLRPGSRRAFRLSAPVEVLEAHATEEVPGVLAAAEAAVRGGRWVAGWVAYEAAPAFDPAMRVRDRATTDVADLPLAHFSVHQRRGAVLGEPMRSYRLGPWMPTITADRHAADVREIRRRIGRGACYQVNATFRLHADFEGDAGSFYRDLVGAQHGGYSALIDAGRWVVASASPELFFEWDDGRVVSKPMKGTAARGRTLDEDGRRREALEASAKDRAENTMIVDMVRNDLGRIARRGTVEVPKLWESEKFDTVWQLTSTVTAEPRAGSGLVDVFAALFPAASITGAPKLAAMDVIADREPDPRGVYCGAIGFGGPGRGGRPRWAFNVGIRTVLIDRLSGVARYGTGGGVTYSSTADGEFAEAMVKTEILRRPPGEFALLETMSWTPGGGVRNLDRHLHRLTGAIEYFDVPCDGARIRRHLERAVQGGSAPLRVRLLVARDGTVRVDVAPPPAPPTQAIRLAIDAVPVERHDPFTAFKTTERRVYEAAAARHPDADDVVLVNDRGEVTETTVANLGVCLDGRWWTPPVSAGCLPGTRRAALLAEQRLQERTVTVAELRRADAIVRFNALREWEPCRLLPGSAQAPRTDRRAVTR